MDAKCDKNQVKFLFNIDILNSIKTVTSMFFNRCFVIEVTASMFFTQCDRCFVIEVTASMFFTQCDRCFVIEVTASMFLNQSDQCFVVDVTTLI